MWLHDALKKYLQENGYDGLCSEECGCSLENLIACGEYDNLRDCEPGYKIPGCTCGEGCAYHISTEKPSYIKCRHCGFEGTTVEFRRKLPDDELTPMLGDEYGEECPECGRCPR